MTPPRPPRLAWKNVNAGLLAGQPTLQADWNRLNAAQVNLPFLDARAIIAALRCFGRGDERLLIASAGDTSKPVAMFVLSRRGAGQWETFQPSQLPLGAWVAEADWTALALAESLLRGPLAASLVLSITQVDPRQSPAPADGPAHVRSDYIETGWIDMAGSFDDYWALRGKNLRSNMRKQRNKLSADNADAELLEWRSASDMAPAIARYGALESAGWKSEKGTAIHPDNDQGRFYGQLMEEAAERGEAVIYEYRLGGRTAAMHLCLRRDAEIVILKTTYDESIDKSLSPAFLLHQEELQRLFGEGQTRRLEYYGRLMEWHTRWTDNKRTLYHLTCYRWPWLKKLKQVISARSSPAADAAGENQVSRLHQ